MTNSTTDGSSIAVGAEDTASSSTDLNHVEFIAKRVMNRRYHIRAVKIVTAPYDASGNPIPPGTPGPIGQVDILPLVNQMDGLGNARPHDVVHGVTYVRLAGGGNAIINDPVAGDIGLALVNDNDWSTVKSTLAQANPASRRRSSASDAVYIVKPADGTTPTQYVAFTSNGINLRDKSGATMVTSDGNMTFTTPGNFVVNGATITHAGEVIDALGKVLGTHVHTEVMTGGDDTGPPA